MTILHDLTEWKPDPTRPVCVAIGFFDGVHLGHQQVIRQAVADAVQSEARAVVITFDRHPGAVVNPNGAPGLIYSNAQKLRVIAQLGIEATILLRFDTAFSRVPAPDFIQNLARRLNPLHSV